MDTTNATLSRAEVALLRGALDKTERRLSDLARLLTVLPRLGLSDIRDAQESSAECQKLLARVEKAMAEGARNSHAQPRNR
jgi:hypothetical protein